MLPALACSVSVDDVEAMLATPRFSHGTSGCRAGAAPRTLVSGRAHRHGIRKKPVHELGRGLYPMTCGVFCSDSHALWRAPTLPLKHKL